MKRFLQSALTLGFFLAFLYRASALKCLKCFSYKSTQDCNERMASVTCDEGFDRCSNTTVELYAAFMNEAIVGYQLDCARQIECQENKCARHFGINMGIQNYRKCVISCCQDNLCPFSPNITTLRPPSNENDVGGPAKGARGGVGRVVIASSMLGIILGIHSLVIS
ncbi:uncharacterized protein LOC116308720 [Actinia tenebrosa]|uniref:Uncharacterized protein LOC116308720 n=1 Tax=Actinia tenebrosa TaxID=6105 RepID=A0A6P8J5R5_ACTTE|nr:uncharacterized protein LOC116308720 [Actinia tenebrosa]